MPVTAPSLEPKPWYKTGTGMIFAILFGIITALALSFLLMTAYYIWHIRYGDPTKIALQFNQNFSQATNLPQAEAAATANIDSLIRPFDPVLGSVKAPVTIVAFIDFQCPFCQESYPIFQKVLDTYGPVVHVVFKHFPLVDLHPDAMTAANAAACAHAKGKFWPYYNELFATQALDQESLIRSAVKAGVNNIDFSSCLANNTYQSQVTTDADDGVAIGVRGTPTYFINGRKLEGVAPYEVWEKTLAEELKKYHR